MSEEVNKESNNKDVRKRSSIQFPYADLESGIDIANAIYKNVGQGDCSTSQIAAWIDHSAQSSGFNLKMAGAKLFGLIESNNGKYQLTDLGKRIVDNDSAREAKIEAFLNVPLYQSVFKSYDGKTLPPSKGLENDIVSMGVAEKVKDRARQYLEKSAEQAGFFETGKNRLVKPSVQKFDTMSAKNNSVEDNTQQPSSSPPVPKKIFHPFIDGLLEELPAKGQPWSEEERQQWLDTAKSIFNMIYKNS